MVGLEGNGNICPQTAMYKQSTLLNPRDGDGERETASLKRLLQFKFDIFPFHLHGCFIVDCLPHSTLG